LYLLVNVYALDCLEKSN